MSRTIWKYDFACFKSDTLSKAAPIRGSWISLSLLTLAMPLFCSSLLLAQQSDRSVLVLEGSTRSAGSNAQVELESEFPNAANTAPTFELPASTEQFHPPTPPPSMTVDAGAAANFRKSAQGTLSANANQTIETRSAAELDRTASDDQSVQLKTTPLMAPDSQTFTRMPSGSESGLQDDNSFRSSHAVSNLRSNSSTDSSRSRFGDFPALSTSKTANRFAPLPTHRSENDQHATAPAIQAATRPASSEVVRASTQQPVRSPASNNEFSSPVTPPSQRFSHPNPSKSAATQPALPSTTQPYSTRQLSPPVSSRSVNHPEANSQSLAPTIGSGVSGRFPSNIEKSAGPASSRSLQPNTHSPNMHSPNMHSPNTHSPNTHSPNTRQSNPFGTSNPRGDSRLRSASNSSSRSLDHGGAATTSDRSSTPMIPREPSSRPSSSHPSSSTTSETSGGSSRLTQQPSGVASQTPNQSYRGRPISNGNDLRNNSSNTLASIAQRSASQSQSNGIADRESIKFAQQQLRNIQPTSVAASGTPVRLQELLLEPLSATQRKQMVVQYWETYYDMAALKIATDYEAWLNSVSVSGAEQGLLSAAQQMASDQQLAAKIQLGKSQSRLLDFMPNPRPSEFAPLPADEPLVQQYVTDYEKYKRVRALPTSMRGIDPMLASTLKLITQRARTVATAKNAADQVGRSVRNQQASLASVIAAGRLWHESQLDMVASTVSYNQAISDFVLTLEPNRSPEQLTAFMLGAPKNYGSESNTRNAQNQSPRSANQSNFPTTYQQFR